MYHDAESAAFFTINAEGMSTIIAALDAHVPAEKLTGRYIDWVVQSMQDDTTHGYPRIEIPGSDTTNGRPLVIDLPDDCFEPEYL